MNTVEATILITRQGEKLTSVAVTIPIWTKKADEGNHLNVSIPMLAIRTVAKDEEDADKAIEESIKLFCIAADQFGHGLEKELQSLGWTQIGETGEPLLGFCASDPDNLINRLVQTGEKFAKEHLEIA